MECPECDTDMVEDVSQDEDGEEIQMMCCPNCGYEEEVE